MAEYIERDAFVEQKRKQYCEDCSRRKGMKNGKYKTLYEIGEAPCRACEIDDMLNDVEDFPAADVQPVVHAVWIPVDEKEDAFDCSECDAMVSKRCNFCPGCGADMRKVEGDG